MASMPSLQTLRAFEAAGRHQSYSRAAGELGLTHGAISHRIRELEHRTGTTLFRREGNRMVPTSEGHILLTRVRHALQILEQVFDDRHPQSVGMLTVSVMPAFASRWLVPRLARFRAAHETVELNLHVTSDLVEIGTDGVDAAVRYGPGAWPGLQCDKLAAEVLFPVCSPEYRERAHIFSPDDLRRCTLLRNPWQSWGRWLHAAGVEIAEPATGPSYPDAALLLQAAGEGEGVALARGLLAADDLKAGRLVRLFDLEVPDAYAYYFVWRPGGKARDPAIEIFRRWLSLAIAETNAASTASAELWTSRPTDLAPHAMSATRD